MNSRTAIVTVLALVCTMALHARDGGREERDLPAVNPGFQRIVLPPGMVDHPATGPESHSVAFAGRRGNRLEIWDPLRGRVLLKQSELFNIWHGNIMTCKRNSSSPVPSFSE